MLQSVAQGSEGVVRGVLAFWGLFSTLGGDLGGCVCISTSIAGASEAAFVHSQSVLQSEAA